MSGGGEVGADPHVLAFVEELTTRAFEMPERLKARGQERDDRIRAYLAAAKEAVAAARPTPAATRAQRLGAALEVLKRRKQRSWPPVEEVRKALKRMFPPTRATRPPAPAEGDPAFEQTLERGVAAIKQRGQLPYYYRWRSEHINAALGRRLLTPDQLKKAGLLRR